MNAHERAKTKAALSGNTSFGTYGNSDTHERYAIKAPGTSRRRCSCGCKARATHTGVANGVALMMGCHFEVLDWVRDPKQNLRKHYEKRTA